MSFIKSSANKTPIVDTVFSIVKLAKQDIEKNGKENVVDATIGSLYDESGKIVAYLQQYAILDGIVLHKYKKRCDLSDRTNSDKRYIP